MNPLQHFDIEELKCGDRALAYLELEKDVVFPHLSNSERLHYLDFALSVGYAQADIYRGRDAFDLAREFGVKVVIQHDSNAVAGVTLRATYEAATRTVELYQASLEQIHQEICDLLPDPWSYEKTAALHLAHELFHHLEANFIEPVDEQLPRIVTARLGAWNLRKLRARRCREIAAHAFAKQLIDFPFLPSALEALMAISHKKWRTSQFPNALERARIATANLDAH